MSSWNEKKIRKVKYSLFGERSKRCYVKSKMEMRFILEVKN